MIAAISLSAAVGIAGGIGFFLGAIAGSLGRDRYYEAKLAKAEQSLASCSESVEYWQRKLVESQAKRRKIVEALAGIIEDQKE